MAAGVPRSAAGLPQRYQPAAAVAQVQLHVAEHLLGDPALDPQPWGSCDQVT